MIAGELNWIITVHRQHSGALLNMLYVSSSECEIEEDPELS